MSTLGAITTAWAASLYPAWRRFARAAADPARAQEEVLRGVLQATASTTRGRALGLSGVTSVAEFRRRVPVATYDDLAPWIDRLAGGEQGVLTVEPVRVMERTSGSTSAGKLVPYPDGLRRDFAAGVDAWLFDLHRAFPHLVGTRSYWSVSPAARRAETTRGGLRIGFADDTEYFGPLTRWALGRMLAVPGSVARLEPVERWRRETCRLLLEAEDLGFVSVWSPSFLTGLLEAVEQDLEGLLADLPAPRAAAIRARLGGGGVTGEALWPRLAVISSWTDGFAAELLPALRRFFPTTFIQPKGLLATEGIVSFPLVGQPGAALALTSHFLEFLDLDRPGGAPLLAHELRLGGRYSPLLSTRGGLLRYHLKDALRVVGRWREVPLVRFEGRTDGTSDLAGEKLGEPDARRALDAVRASGIGFRFALLAPRPEPSGAPRYVLFLDTDAPDETLAGAADLVERALVAAPCYADCRRLGQLGPAGVARAPGGRRAYEAALIARGQRLGDIKPAELDRRTFWGEVFSGR